MLKCLQGKSRSWLPLWPPEGLDAVGSSLGCGDGAASCAQGDFMAESSSAGAGTAASLSCLVLTVGHLSLGGSAAFTRLAPWTLPRHLPLTALRRVAAAFRSMARGTQGELEAGSASLWGDSGACKMTFTAIISLLSAGYFGCILVSCPACYSRMFALTLISNFKERATR